jgi:N-acetylneuraminic acid mutarotase
MWRTVALETTGKLGFAAAVHEDLLCIVGGYGADTSTHHSTRASTLNLNTMQRTSMMMQPTSEPEPQERYRATATVHNGKLYVVGGEDIYGTNLKSGEVHDIAGSTKGCWSPLMAEMVHPRCSHTAVVYENKLYVVGGHSGTIYSAEGTCYKSGEVREEWCRLYCAVL